MDHSFIITIVIYVFPAWLSNVRVMIVTELTPVYCHDAISVISE
jgi:hypothetical protein